MTEMSMGVGSDQHYDVLYHPRAKGGIMECADIIGFGVIAVDDTYIVDGLPAPDTKKKYVSTRRTGGGQTATAFVAASRLGCTCRWCGHLGKNDVSDFVRQVFHREGILFDASTSHPESAPTHAIIINDSRTGSRTLLWNSDLLIPVDPEREFGEYLKSIDEAGCLFVDQVMPEVQVLAARRAAEKGKPVVSDIEYLSPDAVRELAELADHFIFPAAIGPSVFGESEPAAVLRKALGFGRKSVVCMTDGDKGAWYSTSSNPDEVGYQPAFVVEPVIDTNGCGDVFHGAYAASLVKGYSVSECIRRASAAAALKVKKIGGQEGAPYLEELERFLERFN